LVLLVLDSLPLRGKKRGGGKGEWKEASGCRGLFCQDDVPNLLSSIIKTNSKPLNKSLPRD
jgi:hypothetical protein